MWWAIAGLVGSSFLLMVGSAMSVSASPFETEMKITGSGVSGIGIGLLALSSYFMWDAGQGSNVPLASNWGLNPGIAYQTVCSAPHHDEMIGLFADPKGSVIARRLPKEIEVPKLFVMTTTGSYVPVTQ